MKKAVNDVEKGFPIGGFRTIGKSGSWTYKNIPEIGIVHGKGNAVGWRGVVKKLLMELTDFLFLYKVDGNFFTGNGKIGTKSLYSLSYRGFLNGKIFLSVVYVYFQETGVLGSPVTLVFFPSTHLPNFRSTSTRSNLLSTFLFFPPFPAFP